MNLSSSCTSCLKDGGNRDGLAPDKTCRKCVAMAGRIVKYRGYEIEVEPNGLEVVVTVSPTRPDLPILHRSKFRAFTMSEDTALTETRRRIDQLLAF
jgi:hypothetical protein